MVKICYDSYLMNHFSDFEYQKERFQKNLGKVAKKGREFVQEAYNLAEKCHTGQKRNDGTPYFIHCLRITNNLMEKMKVFDKNSLAAALLQGDNQTGTSLFVPKEFNKKDETETPVEQEPEIEEKTQPDLDTDAINKIARVDAQPFYDIKLADENASPTEIVAFTNTLVVTDPNSGKIFTSDINTPKFVAEEQAFTGIKSAINYSGKLNFADNESYKVYDLGSSAVETTYDIQTTLASRYLGNIYSIEDSKIVKYVTSGDEVTSSTWGEDSSLANAKNITVSYSIYAVSSQNDLLVFTQGEKTNFSISGLDTPLGKVTDLSADVNFDYIYLADSGNNRVVVLDTDGNFIKQLKSNEDGAWSDIQSMSVNADETKMYLLNGSKVFEIDLTTANPPAIAGPKLLDTDATTDTVETDGTAE